MTPVLLYTVCHYFPHNNSLAAKGALTHRLQCCTACFIHNGRWGLKIGQYLGYWAQRTTFAKNVFDLTTPSMSKLDN